MRCPLLETGWEYEACLHLKPYTPKQLFFRHNQKNPAVIIKYIWGILDEHLLLLRITEDQMLVVLVKMMSPSWRSVFTLVGIVTKLVSNYK